MKRDERYVLAEHSWRVGRKRGRNIYAVIGDEPSDADPEVGRMESDELARLVVETHNRELKP